jgi:predicted sugar kinase
VMARSGALGIGQSSWGPTVYGMAADLEQANALEERIRKAVSGKIEATTFLARGCNRGAEVIP